MDTLNSQAGLQVTSESNAEVIALENQPVQNTTARTKWLLALGTFLLLAWFAFAATTLAYEVLDIVGSESERLWLP
jgi:hypothetical protein